MKANLTPRDVAVATALSAMFEAKVAKMAADEAFKLYDETKSDRHAAAYIAAAEVSMLAVKAERDAKDKAWILGAKIDAPIAKAYGY